MRLLTQLASRVAPLTYLMTFEFRWPCPVKVRDGHGYLYSIAVSGPRAGMIPRATVPIRLAAGGCGAIV